MYNLRPDPSILRELGDPQRYQAKVARQLMLSILGLALNPRPQDCKPIDRGYRVDSGEYRIYYEIDDAHQVVEVLQEEILLSEVVRRLLQKWVAGEVMLDEPPPDEATVERPQ